MLPNGTFTLLETETDTDVDIMGQFEPCGNIVFMSVLCTNLYKALVVLISAAHDVLRGGTLSSRACHKLVYNSQNKCRR